MPPHSKPGHWAQRVNTNKARGMMAGFRSGLEEANSAHLERLGVPVEYETLVVPWVMPQKLRRYTPDFRLPNGIIVETKGIFAVEDRAKHLFIKVQYPELDVRFVFSSLKTKIALASKTTVVEWAESHGFKWAVKLIPEAWTQEAGPRLSPEQVLMVGPVGYLEFLQREGKRGR